VGQKSIRTSTIGNKNALEVAIIIIWKKTVTYELVGKEI
jgi:hypothetical protein